MKEIYSLIHGGLGNQLAQIACGFIISEEVGREFFFDKRVMGPTHSKSHDILIWKILSDNFTLGYVPDNKYYIEYNYGCWRQLIKFLKLGGFSDRAILLGGLMHEWESFYQYKDKLFNLFSPFISQQKIKGKIGFHFRLGDYTYYLPDLVISKKYIHGAIKGMIERGAPREIDVLTEEPNKACGIIMEALKISPSIKDIKINFIHEDDLTTFYKMQSYEYFISSLSSFSWWGNFLGMALNKNRVISLVETKNFHFSENQFCPES